MSAASFISMAGALYANGYDGLAYVMGWTGGYVLLAVFLAPYLRKFGQYTIPDFLGARYGGNFARSIGIFAAILASFTYLIAQVTGVGIITSRFLGIPFNVGVFAGLGGILVCSMLGGMRAVTWTQVAQYLILIIAYLTPVTVMSYKTTGIPIPELAYGQILQKIDAKEKLLISDPKELEVRGMFKKQAADLDAKIKGLPASLDDRGKCLMLTLLLQRMIRARKLSRRRSPPCPKLLKRQRENGKGKGRRSRRLQEHQALHRAFCEDGQG